MQLKPTGLHNERDTNQEKNQKKQTPNFKSAKAFNKIYKS